ncbi:Coiled-coil domain-containing protein 51 [Merluccius polli]|uniref:Coiled-coil domain-containing protein 51 n=1 Tax=Merluccius polli TaxID=89951 RepID=A0AA47M9K0_MERPO|nr:Coiled-coil domain-containing protein 51 [Merluccius polli]
MKLAVKSLESCELSDKSKSRGSQIVWRSHRGSCCPYRLPLLGRPHPPLLAYSTLSPPDPTPPERGGTEVVKERSLAALKYAGMLGREWGQRSSQVATATVNYWWARYEEFVGLIEVREAQARVNEAETSFMVSRGLVQEAQTSMEAVQQRLKEVRTRLDRVSREEPHYLELATLEHKLLQEERRERSAYEGAEVSERQRFALFSAAVRSSHEKERTRAERTKNWSLMGSLLGTVIGVMGSTYVNRVRLQELKSLLLEAQKGPESLQEVLRVQAGDHRNQHGELQALIDTLRGTIGHTEIIPSHAPRTPPTDSPLATLQPHLAHLEGGVAQLEKGVASLEGGVSQLERGVSRVEEGLSRLEGGVTQLEGGVAAFRSVVEVEEERRKKRSSVGPSRWEGGAAEEEMLRRLEEAQEQLEEAVQRSGMMNSAVSVVAAAITVPLLYFLLRTAG